MKEKIILFGAGVYAKKYKSLLEYLHMDFNYFTDNDSTKWGTELYGKPVISPTELRYYPGCKIIISSTHESAIRKQLSDMGFEACIIGLDELYDLCEHRMESEEDENGIKTDKETIIVDMYEGIGWGGTELWAATLARGLRNEGEKVILLGGTEQPRLEDYYEDLITRIEETETITRMVDLFENNLPCVFVNNFAGCAFMASVIVKRKYPDLVKIISVIHNDNKSLFEAHMMLKKYIDKVFCVSNQIRKHMLDIYDFESERYYFKEQPIESETFWRREENQSGVLRIGYAARLVRQQKRADLLVPMIAYLEQKAANYRLQIAGDGECVDIVDKYIAQKNLQDKVQILGRLSKGEMADFWKKQDVFISVSEYEGTSLAMLEAMSFGCVPVVTDVSGTREFIVDGENGYVRDVEDIKGIVECVIKLDQDRGRLMLYGMRCREIIENRCNPEEYIRYWKKHLL